MLTNRRVLQDTLTRPAVRPLRLSLRQLSCGAPGALLAAAGPGPFSAILTPKAPLAVPATAAALAAKAASASAAMPAATSMRRRTGFAP
jgi:hypothetical protein